MQSLEMTRLLQAFETMFPHGFIRIINQNNKIVQKTTLPPGFPDEPVSYSGFQEILTVYGKEGQTFYQLSFPIPPINQLFVCLPTAQVEDVLTAAKMADSTIQLFLSHQGQSSPFPRQSDMTLLLDHLLHPASTEDHTYTVLLAAELGIDLSLPRAVCIFHVEHSAKAHAAKAQTAYSILQTMRSFISSGSQDMLGAFGSCEIILCHVMEENGKDSAQLLESLYMYINKNYPVTCSVGIGLTVNSIDRYADSLSSARAAFLYAHNRANVPKRIFYITDFLVEHLVYEIPEAVFEHFFEKELSYLKTSETALETIEALITHNMDIHLAAEALFIHRNTMVFRLNQLKKQLGMNPLHKDNDRFRLILLYHYYIKKETL
ncbi:PucR family transcriptional regulator [Lacrimispora sp. 210928-DFI.3.58]|uniref:PucR family transcriptional regulator n=1 Tax=Lacrimispora sp. 210928-DFI.3.58 TaxID=2883214 RepID=UPI0015B3AEC6|nr:helix-turn-helix domain-containing protein [Lacrimispora sp. 210928-DFI.3.58]MCB7319408.1 helix-turn-helix domain-containing protein [Lacrimispora sp. 210928-DFI.3.58]